MRDFGLTFPQFNALANHREDNHSNVDQEASIKLFDVGKSTHVPVAGSRDRHGCVDEPSRVDLKRGSFQEVKPVYPGVVVFIREKRVHKAYIDKQAGETMHQEANNVDCLDCHVDVVDEVLVVYVVVRPKASELVKALKDTLDSKKTAEAHN